MTYYVDRGPNPHVNYEPSALGGLEEAAKTGKDHTSYVQGNLVRQKIERENNFKQAGETYRAFTKEEQDELISNLVDALKQCREDIQQRMVHHFTLADAEYGRRVAEGIGMKAESGAREEQLASR